MKLQRFTNGVKTWWGQGGNASDFHALLAGDSAPPGNILDLICQSDMVPPIDPFYLLESTQNQPYYDFNFEISSCLSPAEIAAVLSLTRDSRPRIDIDWDQLNATPEAVKFQITHKHWRCIGFERAYELGRFFTRKNEVGIITSLQTEVSFENNLLRWPRGDSAWYRRNLGVDEGEVNVSWALKIESLPHTEPSPTDFRLVTITDPLEWFNQIPGQVHPEISPWNEMLFLWGLDPQVRFRCPQNTCVSLWIYRHTDLTADGVLAYGGMIKGFTQVMGSDRTYENMTRIY